MASPPLILYFDTLYWQTFIMKNIFSNRYVKYDEKQQKYVFEVEEKYYFGSTLIVRNMQCLKQDFKLNGNIQNKS
jgi:hypothetical protein